MTDFRGTGVAARPVRLFLGDKQNCTATTDSSGSAACAIDPVNQPLTDAATVPVRASFAGDDFTGRAAGLSANLAVVTLPAQPDTGPVRTASVGSTDVACGAALDVVVLRASALCPKVVSAVRPGRITSTSTLRDVRVGVPVPVDPHSTVTLPGGTTLVVNEQHAADGGLAVTAAHLVLAGGLGEVVVAPVSAAAPDSNQ